MKMNLSLEEVSMIMKHRQEEYDKNRPERHYSKECKYTSFDADGDFCTLGKGYGVNSHCWARCGKECPFFEAVK